MHTNVYTERGLSSQETVGVKDVRLVDIILQIAQPMTQQIVKTFEAAKVLCWSGTSLRALSA